MLLVPRSLKLTHLFALMVLLALGLAPTQATLAGPAIRTNNQPSVPELNAQPLTFVPNTGQAPEQVSFLTRAIGGTLFFTPSAVVLALPAPDYLAARNEDPTRRPSLEQHRRIAAAAKQPPTLLRVAFDGANPNPTIVGADVQPGVVNYLLGDDPSAWRTNLPSYAGVTYQELYPGISLRYDGIDGRIKSTYTVAIGANPAALRWNYTGAQNVKIDKDGNLAIKLAPPRGRDKEDRTLTEQAPIAWQDIMGRRVPVAVAYAVAADDSVSFTLGQYDPAFPLTIDPILTYSTYLGGTGNDQADAITVSNSDGSVYVTGNTQSNPFPTTAPYQGSFGGVQDAFVTKYLNGVRVYSTYYGGNDYDTSAGIAIDSSNQIYITGNTSSTNLSWPNGYDSTLNGTNDVYLIKLNASGSSILYGTLLGGSNTEIGYDVTVSGSKASIVGVTNSTNMIPASLPTGTKYYDKTANGVEDAFVVQFDTASSGNASLKYISYLGGSNTDYGYSIALNSSGVIYITGFTYSTNLFPSSLPSGTKYYDKTANGGQDAFVAGLNPATSGTSSLTYATYFGGSSADSGQGIAVDTTGKIYITGQTYSTDIPIVLPYDSSHNGNSDVFVAHFDPAISSNGSLRYSTYLGGVSSDIGRGIAVELGGWATIVGSTESTDFSMRASTPMQTTLSGTSDAFVAKFFPPINFVDGKTLVSSAYLGGSSTEGGVDAAVDSQGRTYITGTTSSSDFPIRGGPNQNTNGGLQDGFVAKIFPEYDQQCHWPHTVGVNKTLYYNWGNGLTAPGTGWRSAFEAAIQSWNSTGTRFILSENATQSTVTMMLFDLPTGPAGATDPICSGSTLIHADVKVNTAVVTAPVQGVPAHEIGHGQGLGHIAHDSTLMRYDTGGFSGPQSLDVELHRLIYP